jgi:hypothetical protein
MAHLRRLEQSDILSIDANNTILTTKIEMRNFIREFVKSEVANFPDNFLLNQKSELQTLIEQKFLVIEKSIDAFIEYKFDKLSEKICEILITRKFNEEVEKKAQELITKKQAKGKF